MNKEKQETFQKLILEYPANYEELDAILHEEELKEIEKKKKL